MFALLSRLRLVGPTEQAQDDADDASSINRSLNLPWPVTESSTRRPATSNPARRDWMPGQAPPQASSMSISYPIPRSQPNSLTGFSDYITPPSGSIPSNNSALALHNRPARAAPPQSIANPNAWYEQEKPRRLNQRIQPAAGAVEMHSPPEVVRLNSTAFIPSDEDENIEDSPPPRYAQQDSSALYSTQPYPNLGYATSTNTDMPTHQTLAVASDRDDNEDESEFYSSPFDSDPDDAATITPRSINTTATSSLSSIPRSGGTTMPKSKWGLKIQLQSAQSMPSLRTGTGVSHPLPTDQHPLSQDSAQRFTHPTHDSSPLEAGPYPMGVGVDTDVYNNSYNYPLAKQLSPIPEQDYFSPAVESPASRFERAGHSPGSLRKASPGAESLESRLGRNTEQGTDLQEQESSKIRSGHGRSGSVGSATTINGNSISRAGSVGSEITRPSPIYASPFLTRHLNRTISQSSSKSDSQSAHPQTPGTGQTPAPFSAQGQTPIQSMPSMRPTAGMTHVSTAVPRSAVSSHSHGSKEMVQTPISAATSGTTGTMYTPTSTLQTPAAASPGSPIVLAGTSVGTPSVIHPPPPVMVITAPCPPPQPTSPATITNHRPGFPKIPSLPSIPPLDLRFSILGSFGARGSREIRDRISKAGSARKGPVVDVPKMPVIDGSVDAYYEEEDDPDGEDLEEEDDEDDEYDRESLHAESFVTAGTNEDIADGDENHDLEHGVELTTFNKTDPNADSQPVQDGPLSRSRSPRGAIQSTTGESFIDRRWERDAGLGLSTSPTTLRANSRNTRWPVRFSKPRSSLSPAFWTFWLGFVFPVLWLVGGWHFTNAGELPPRFTVWEWYFWNSNWSFSACLQGITNRVFGCCMRREGRAAGHKLKKPKTVRGSQDSAASVQHSQRRKGKARSTSQPNVRQGQVYPALPRWVAEKQSSDDGRMRLNDPKRSLRGISFGYPFIERPPASQDSGANRIPPRASSPLGYVMRILRAPNRMLDQLYGVKLMEVRGRPESGRRMFDPWIQRCRYAMCYALLLLAAGLCTASAYLIAVNTKKIAKQ